MLAGFQCQTFMSHVLQGNYFLPDFFLREFLAGNRLVLGMIGAVGATVHAMVRQIKRSEHHDAVAVKLLFDFFGEMEDTLRQVRLVAFQQECRFAVGQSFAEGGFFDKLLNQGTVVLIVLGIIQRIQNLVVVDKLFCF